MAPSLNGLTNSEWHDSMTPQALQSLSRPISHPLARAPNASREGCKPQS